MDQRLEHVVIETERYRIQGDLHLPAEGYRSRLSDYINQRATIFADFGTGYPAANLGQVGKIFDISKLEQFHR